MVTLWPCKSLQVYLSFAFPGASLGIRGAELWCQLGTCGVCQVLSVGALPHHPHPVPPGQALPCLAHHMPRVSSADGRFLLLPPCLGEQPSRDVEREALALRVRRVEEENQQLRLQLGQAQAEGSDGNPQWGASAEDGDPPRGERSNRTACPKQRMVHKCEVGDSTSMVVWWIGNVEWEAGTLAEHGRVCSPPGTAYPVLWPCWGLILALLGA